MGFLKRSLKGFTLRFGPNDQTNMCITIKYETPNSNPRVLLNSTQLYV